MSQQVQGGRTATDDQEQRGDGAAQGGQSQPSKEGRDGGPPASSQNGAGGGEQTKRTREPGRSAAEWVSLGISLAILLTLVGLITYEYFAHGTEPPVIRAQPRLDELRREGDTYYVPVDIINYGDLTASDVRVRVSLTPRQGEQEAAEFTIPFLAGGASARGTVVLRHDPSAGRLEAEVLGFLEP